VPRSYEDENSGFPLAKLRGSNHYLFKDGLIGSINNLEDFFEPGRYKFQYYGVNEIERPTCYKPDEKAQKFSIFLNWKVQIFYLALLCSMYYFFVSKSWTFIEAISAFPDMVIFGYSIFGDGQNLIVGFICILLLLGLPELIYDVVMRSLSDKIERNSGIRIKNKNAALPFSYIVSIDDNTFLSLVRIISIVVRFSVVLSIFTFNPNIDEPILLAPVAFSTIILTIYFSLIFHKYLMPRYPWRYNSTKSIPSIGIDEFYELLLNEIDNAESQRTTEVEELIKNRGESDRLELKASYWTVTKDENYGSQNKLLEDVIVKEVSAFLNTRGGTILIGVHDEKPFNPTNILEQDLSHSPKVSNKDQLDSHIRNILQQNIRCSGIVLGGYWDILFEPYRGSDIVRINVKKGPKHVLCYQPNKQGKKGKDKKKKFGFVRRGSKSEPLALDEWSDWITQNNE